MTTHQVAIIGAGPAGLTTALQVKRFGIPALVLEGSRIGGLLHNANLVENYPGFPGGITGPALVRLFERQAQDAGVEVTPGEVLVLGYVDESFQLETCGQAYRARVVVVAAGTKPRLFPEGLIPANARERVFYEIRPLLGVVGKRIVIVGAGDAAFDYALNLAEKNEVVILNRGSRVKSLPLLRQRARENKRIAYRPETEIERVAVASGEALTVRCSGREDVFTMEADYLVGALGRVPRLDFLSSGVQEKKTELTERGVLHFVGDVKNGLFRQTAIAAGDGLLAAMKIYRYFEEMS
ncbi:MAG: NAD(P)/FAD-dependent oxidoreductase [Chloroflexi bacterium]|nr:NAD(P)/FAD-dependent oxidoreductase [Chloroflexota bacterium]